MPASPVRRSLIQGLLALVMLAVLGGLAAPAARAQGVELLTLRTVRSEGSLDLEFAARITLPKAVEDALVRGVPIYFVAEATLLRSRWYWRDERVARVSRSWRLMFQPLTSAWRVSLGGLNQSYGSMEEALSAVSRATAWRLVDLKDLDDDGRHYVEFGYRLDTSQLPGPMQFGLVGQGEWAVGVRRTLRVEP